MPRKRQRSQIHPLQPKSREACVYHENVFRPRLARLRQEIESTPLTVLVWGKGTSRTIYYKQRVAIVNALRQINVDAEISEALVDSVAVWSIRSQEFIQAMAADVIVLLCMSEGSIAELADFQNHMDIARKIVAFLDRKNKSSYVAIGPARDLSVFGHVHYYDYPEDFSSGELLNTVLHTIRQYQMAAWLRQSVTK